MAKARVIFQPVLGGVFHATEVGKLLAAKTPTAVTISSAYVHSQGVRTISAALAPHAGICRCFIGIRNGASTLQGVKALIDLGASVYAVDTGSQRRIFHPKFYAVRHLKTATVILGSANLTYGGLGYNIETSAHISLDLKDPGDLSFIDDLTNSLDGMLTAHPKNCYKIASAAQADAIFNAGLLEDETSPKFNSPVGMAASGAVPGNTVPAIGLPAMPKPPKPAPSKTGAAAKSGPAKVKASPLGTPVAFPVMFGAEVWSKPNLPKSDLQFPGASGNATGVLRLTQAKFEVAGAVIDQTTYFRKIVFGSLKWAASSGKETAQAQFTLTIAGVIVGTFDLMLSHKAAWEAGQGNYTTGLHWGAALPLINDASLVGRELRLYAPAAPGAPYVISID